MARANKSLTIPEEKVISKIHVAWKREAFEDWLPVVIACKEVSTEEMEGIKYGRNNYADWLRSTFNPNSILCNSYNNM